MFDVLIRQATIIDGTRAPRFTADIGIKGDRIDSIGDLSAAEARQTIDAAGLVAAPGFIDVHTHADGWLLKSPHLLPKTLQGFTTEVLMADGISYAPVTPQTWRDWIFYLRALDGMSLDEYSGWSSIAEFLDRIAGRNVQNVIAQVPYANVRSAVCGWGRQRPDDFQMRSIIRGIRKAMDEGAVGLSTGLDYIVQCFATTDELVAACQPVAEQGGLYVTHMRYKLGLLPALREAVEIARRSGAKLHVSHLKAQTPQAADEVLTYLDREASREVDLSFDVYPYQSGSTMLSYLLPYEVWESGPIAAVERLRDPQVRERFNRGLTEHRVEIDKIHIAWVASKENSRHQGKLLSDYVDSRRSSPGDALADLLIEERLAVLLVVNEGDDPLVTPFLQHPKQMVGTDGILCGAAAIPFSSGPKPESSDNPPEALRLEGRPHPRVFGSASRVLGPLVREVKLFSLEEAVHKLSGYAASRFGLKQRGELKPGNFADLVLFDPDTISDQATYEEPLRPTVGMHAVLVNGTPIIEAGQPVPSERLPRTLPGRHLRCER
ncbi:MAG: N-acyl-D-amino-acid deacylase [Planctomycetota bacterium]|nr:MAG: N-acyl-D-amino-acid deacylase [Planctomycetota bacterium]